MIYNARADMIFYADMADIDDSVFEYVNDAAEKQSLVNEKLIKQMMGELVIYGKSFYFRHIFYVLIEHLFKLGLVIEKFTG